MNQANAVGRTSIEGSFFLVSTAPTWSAYVSTLLPDGRYVSSVSLASKAFNESLVAMRPLAVNIFRETVSAMYTPLQTANESVHSRKKITA